MNFPAGDGRAGRVVDPDERGGTPGSGQSFVHGRVVDTSQLHTIIAEEEEAFLDDIADVFCISAKQPLERWRPFVDITDKHTLSPAGWTPEFQHQTLLDKRAWQARSVHQYTLLTVLAEEWEVYQALCAFRIAALLEMRHTEIALADFQLACGMVGVDSDKTPKDDLYYAAVCVHSTHLHCHDVLAKTHKEMRGARKSVMADKVSRTDSFVDMVRNLMRQVHQLHLIIPPTMASIRMSTLNDEGDGTQNLMLNMTRRLTMVIKALDTVLTVTTTENLKARKMVQV